MTLREKLALLKINYEILYRILVVVVPDLVANPETPSRKDLEYYNFWVDSLDEDVAQEFYHFAPISYM